MILRVTGETRNKCCTHY